MSPEDRAALRSLLTGRRLLTLGVVVEGRPITGLLPFVVLPDFSGVLVHASRLAKHTAGLTPDAPFSLLIHDEDRPEADPLQIPRLTIQGQVQPVPLASATYHADRGRYLAHFPASAPTFALADFTLFRLLFSEGRYVAGFGRAFNLTPESLRGLSEPPPRAWPTSM